jgi:hypothetical protein
MLVRFLSYIASIIGAKRYKPVLISCLTLVLSITGVTIIASAINSGSPDKASQAAQSGNDSKNSGQQPSSTTSLNGLEQKSTKDDSGQAIQQQKSQSGSSSAPSQQQSNGSSSNNGTPFDIALNASTINLTQASPNAAVTVAATHKTSLQWSITPDANAANAGINATIDSMKDSQGNAVVRFRADNITPGTYTFQVTATDNAHGTTASKTVTVTVN